MTNVIDTMMGAKSSVAKNEQNFKMRKKRPDFGFKL